MVEGQSQLANGDGRSDFANMMGGKMEAEAPMLCIPEMKIGTFTVQQAGAVSRPDGIFERTMRGAMTEPIIGSVAGNVLRDFRVEIDYQNGCCATAKRLKVRVTCADLL